MGVLGIRWSGVHWQQQQNLRPGEQGRGYRGGRKLNIDVGSSVLMCVVSHDKGNDLKREKDH